MAEKSLGIYLLDELYKRDVRDIFGIPGDYILRFDKLIEEHKIAYINATRENTAGYMADAYARIKGIGVVCITYGVGLNIVNAVSQAYSENSPLVLISGAPGEKELERSHYLHHLIHKAELRRFENTQLEILKHITADQAILNHPDTAPQEIRRVLDTAVRKQKPVYIEIPRDVVDKPLTLNSHTALAPYSQETATKAESLALAKKILEEAHFPLICVGHEVQRLKLAEFILPFAEKNQIPLATTLLGKSTFDERHPLVLGVYQGKLSREDIQAYIDKVDGVLLLGAIQTDLDTGMFTSKLKSIPHFELNLQSALPEFCKSLSQLTLNRSQKIELKKRDLPHFPFPTEDPLTVKKIFSCLQEHVQDDQIYIADVGDCLFGASDLRLPQNAFISNAYFASLGFAVPAAIGAAIACPEKRVIAIVGDGAFQISGMELSTAVRYGLDPIIILLNNQGYGTERPLIEGHFNDIVNWNYTLLPKVFGGGAGIKAATELEFATALKHALSKRGTMTLIEAQIDKLDFSDAAKRFGTLVKQVVRTS